MPKALMLVFSQPASPELDAEYNRWYSEKHLPDLTRIPGLVSATRYKLDKSVVPMPGIESDPRGYLAIYELEGTTSADLARFTQAMQMALENGGVDVSSTLDVADISASFALPITERLMPA